MENKFDIKECLRFLASGCFVVLVDFSVYRLLFPHTSIIAAKAIAYIAGTVTGFFINKYWTFKSKKTLWKEAVRYAILYACSAIVNTLVNKAMFTISGLLILAYLVATGISTVLNFLGQKFFIFNKANGGSKK